MYNKMYTVLLLLPALWGLLILSSCKPKSQKTVEIRGVYGNPLALWEKGYHLNDLGVNAVFVHSGSISHEMVDRAKSEGARVFAEFATLNGKNYVEKHPEAWAINEKGEKVKAASWFMGVCPTEPGFRKYRKNQLIKLLLEYELNGVWMDYLHWHAQFEEPEPILPETCFNDPCIKGFTEDSGIKIPQGTTSEKALWILDNHEKEWRKWRCKIIYSWTEELKKVLREIRPDALLGLYHCPWTDAEFNGTRRSILGLDYNLLQKTVDVFSPMVYHGRMGRDPAWVSQNVDWLSGKLNVKNNTYPKIWPIVQAHNDPGIITAKAFETVLKGALTGTSSGVMMFTTDAVADDENKTRVMTKFYKSLDTMPSFN